MRSVAFGIWVAWAAATSGRRLHGASHFLEHLLFKGTKRRDALEISSVMDAVGGEMNAFTAKEYTCYYARVLDEDLAARRRRGQRPGAVVAWSPPTTSRSSGA